MPTVHHHRPVFRPLPAATAGALAAALLAAGPGLRAQTVSTWNGGNDSWSNAGFWTPTGAPNSANANVFVDGGKTGTASTVNVDGGYTVGRLTVDAGDAVSVNNSLSLTFTDAGGFTGSGSLVNNGTVTLVSFNGFQTSLVFNGATSLSGGGVVSLQEASRIRGSGTLTNTSTILGNGAVGNNELSVVNRGVIDASGGGTITLDPAPGSGTFINQGLLRGTSAGGVLQLTGNGGGTFNNAGGTIAALGGAEVRLTGGATVSGGTFATLGTGVIRTANSDAATLGSLTNTGAFIASNNSVTTLLADTTLTNNGTFTLESFNRFQTSLVLTGNATLAGTGALELSDSARIRGTGTLTNAAGHTIRGETNGSGSIGNGEIAIVNAGAITATVNGTPLVITPVNVANGFTNTATGTVNAVNGGIATLSGSAGTFTNNGTFAVRDANSQITVAAGALTNLSGTTLTGGTYRVTAPSANAPATLSLGGGVITTNNADVRLSGPGAAFPAINALADNQGSFRVGDGRGFTTAGALTNSGVLVSFSGGGLTVAGNLTNSGIAGIANGTGGSAFAVQGTLASSGTLVVSNFDTVSATGTINVGPTGQVLGNGTFAASALNLSGGVRPGDSITFNTGNVTPAVGFLTLDGPVNLSGTSLLNFDLGALAASDRLQVNGLTLDGTLNVAAVSGFGVGRYDLIDYSGALTNNVLDLGTLPAGYNYALDLATAGQVALVVSAVPEPGTYALAVGGLALLLLGQRRRAGLLARR